MKTKKNGREQQQLFYKEAQIFCEKKMAGLSETAAQLPELRSVICGG